MNVAVIGASDKPGRYSYQAVMELKQKGHTVFPVNAKLQQIEGLKVYPSLRDVAEKIDTVTLYVGAAISTKLQDEILAASPRRIIFNPGAENPALRDAAEAKGIRGLEACTLVMLHTNQF